MLFVTAESSCERCRSALFLQRLDGHVFCHPCGALTPLAPEFGDRALRAVLALGRGLTDGGTSTTSVDGVRLLVRRAGPACPSCGVAWRGPCEHCPACGLAVRARRIAGATVLGEAPPPSPPTPGASQQSIDALLCRTCGASVPLDHMPDSVACAYCGTTNHVPRSFYYRGHMATARKLAIEPDEALETSPRGLPSKLLGTVPVEPDWPFFPQPDGGGVLAISAERNDFTDGGLFSVDGALGLRWARQRIDPRGFPGPTGAEVSYLTGPGVIAWVAGVKLCMVDVFTGEDLPSIPFPDRWRELYRHPSVLLASGPVFVKAGAPWRWDGAAFVKADLPALQGAHFLQSAGNEVWVARLNSKGTELARLSWDFSLLGRATAKPVQEGASWSMAFAGESACALVVGRSVSLSTGATGKLTEVFKLPKTGRSRLMSFGAEGFTFLRDRGGVQRFDHAGHIVLDAAAGGSARAEGA
ncbi:MAG: hypothetical protein IT374_17425 [Polyangiaceae bacterium]|nr:hypothetical protein [Polyangiaceae bacterium]